MGNVLKFGGGKSDRRFIAFEEKSIDEQAGEISTALIMKEENPLFTFDRQDEKIRYEFNRTMT